MLVYAVISAAIILVAQGQEQELVLVYAVAVFLSFLAGLLAMARFTYRRGSRLLASTNLLAAVVVVFTLIVNLLWGFPLISMAATVLVAGGLYWRWVRAGRPAGLEAIEREVEETDPAPRGGNGVATQHPETAANGSDSETAKTAD